MAVDGLIQADHGSLDKEQAHVCGVRDGAALKEFVDAVACFNDRRCSIFEPAVAPDRDLSAIFSVVNTD